MFRNFFKNESGQGMVEYALIIALIAVVAIAGLTLLGPAIKEKFTTVTTEITNAGASSAPARIRIAA